MQDEEEEEEEEEEQNIFVLHGRVAANILNKQSRISDKGWSSSLGLTTQHKKPTCYGMLHRASELS
jgi:HD superfamily phosphohydrolase YqeK